MLSEELGLGTGWSSHPGGSSTALWSAATRLAGEVDRERLAGAAAAIQRLPDTTLPGAEGTHSPTGGISPDGAGVAFLASERSQYVVPRQATQRWWRLPLSPACPQSGQACLDII